MALRNNFICSLEIHQNIRRSSEYVASSFKVMGHGSDKAVAYNSKTIGQKLLGLDRNSCYDIARCNSELLAFWPWPLTLGNIFVCFLIQAQSFECLKLAASFLVWGYIFKIYRSLSTFKIMGLISSTRSQNSGSAQVCAPLGRCLIQFAFWITRQMFPASWRLISVQNPAVYLPQTSVLRRSTPLPRTKIRPIWPVQSALSCKA